MARRRDRAVQRMLDRAGQDGSDPAQPAATGAALDLDRALAALNDDERTAVLLCYAGGMSHAEAAEAMGAPLGTVKSWVNRGREKLKERLGSYAPA
jgi:RNA polymerase sigma-70 factor (ECF subfamily)